MTVSVIIPAYNAESWIGRCLKSTIDQTYRDLEIVVLNDGSEDNTLQILEEFARHDSRIVIIDKENSGTYSTRKLGILKSVGELIFHADADDYLEPNALELLVKRIKSENCDLVIGNHFQVVHGRKRIVINRHPKDRSKIGLLKSLLRNDLKGYVWGRIYKKHLLTDLHYKVDGLLQEDFLINLHVLLAHEVRISIEDSPVYNYIIHKQSANSNRNPLFVDNVFQFIGIVERILRDAGLFEELREEFQLLKCRNWIVYARLGGRLAKDKNFSKNFFKQNFTNGVKLNLPFHQKMEMIAYRYNHNFGRALTTSMKQVANLIH